MTEGYIWGKLLGGVVLLIVVAIILMMNDSGKENVLTQICPKCGKRTLRKTTKKDEFTGKSTRKWKCSNCGNDEDEFGNKL